ncbi:MAG: AAA family ATPase, partial [bacterium]|nr:AAA family ATPase [bacterium]
LAWFILPLASLIAPNELGLSLKLIVFSGIVLFVHHIVAHPHKKIRQIKKAEEIWQCSFVNKNKLDLRILLKDEGVIKYLTYLEKTPDDFSNFPKIYSEEEVWQKAFEIGKKIKTPYLRPEHFFAATILSILNVENELMKIDLTQEDLVDTLDYLQKRADTWRMILLWDDDFAIHHLKGTNRGWLGAPTPSLDLVSEDLTKKASGEKIPDFIGRKEVILEVINILSLSEGRNVVLVGEPGSGRGALVDYLAKMIVAGDAPDALATKRLVFLDFTRLLSGIKEQGDLAERLKNIFEEANYSGNIIIFVDEIQNFGLGEAGVQYNLLSLLIPLIESSKIQFITTTEPGNYAKVLERNGSFLRLFTKVNLSSATSTDTVEILMNRGIDFERKEKIRTSIPAIKTCVKLSEQFIHDRVLPDSALHIYKISQVNPENLWINKKVIEKTIQSQIKIPISGGDDEAKKQILNLEETIHQRLIDQEEAVTAIANTLRRQGAELRDQKRPIGSFLFVGPTGVGKTELAKILSEVYFIDKGNFLRLDMSEFQTADAITRLLGSENNEGLLTDVIRVKPFTLILLDEFEKADSKILNLFLQVLDDGRLTDGKGRTVDFTNTIIIATSNAASLIIAENLSNGGRVEQ